jgi:hypothetical protein
MAVTDQELNVIAAVTGRFENAGDPWTGVTGDFDGMGISCGVLQWNIGSLSLQPMVKAVGKTIVVAAAPTIGEALWTACNTTAAKGLVIVRGWQSGTTLRAGPRRELAAVMGTPQMRAQQASRIRAIAENADTQAAQWAHAAGRPARTLRELAWFFDLLTQNGGLKGVTYAQVRDFIHAATPSKADDVACDWLAGVPASWWGKKDSTKNAALWRDKVAAADLELFIASYLRASIAGQVKARGVVLNRKGALALRKGWVNTELFDFSAQLGG